MCTLFINEDYRKKGYSKLILEDSFAYLKTDKPLLTIPESRLDEFSKIINTYGWSSSRTTEKYYSTEVIFNEDKARGLILK